MISTGALQVGPSGDGLTNEQLQQLANSGSDMFWQRSVRFQVLPTAHWHVAGDDQFGYNIESAVETAGLDDDPTIEWIHRGLILPAGVTIVSAMFRGRSSTNQITDMELALIESKPTANDGFVTGISSDAELTNTTIYRDFFMNPQQSGSPFTGDIQHDHIRAIDDINYTTDRLSSINLYGRSVGRPVATRHFFVTMYLQLQTAGAPAEPQPAIGPEQDSDFTAIKGLLHPVNTLDGPVVVAPPPSPIAGDRFSVTDSRANAGTNNITVDFITAGQNFHGGDNNSVLSVDTDFVQYVYVDSTIGWITER